MTKNSAKRTKTRGTSKREHRATHSASKTLPTQCGLAYLVKQQAAKRDAKIIYKMVTEPRGTLTQLLHLARHDSLFELICIAIDQGKRARHLINASRSRRVAMANKNEARAILRKWLAKNMSRYTSRPWRVRCIEAAKRALPTLARGDSWIDKEITLFQAERRAEKSRN